MAETSKDRGFKEKEKRGRNPTRKQVVSNEPDPITVQKLANQLDASEYHHCFSKR